MTIKQQAKKQKSKPKNRSKKQKSPKHKKTRKEQKGGFVPLLTAALPVLTKLGPSLIKAAPSIIKTGTSMAPKFAQFAPQIAKMDPNLANFMNTPLGQNMMSNMLNSEKRQEYKKYGQDFLKDPENQKLLQMLGEQAIKQMNKL